MPFAIPDPEQRNMLGEAMTNLRHVVGALGTLAIRYDGPSNVTADAFLKLRDTAERLHEKLGDLLMSSVAQWEADQWERLLAEDAAKHADSPVSELLKE